MPTFERIMRAAKNTSPSAEQIAEWTKRESEMSENDYDRIHPDLTPKSALTGWDGRTIDVENIQWSNGYAERGYSDPDKAILFGNWNHVSRRVQDILERAGFKLEWEDEWMTCGNCGKAVRSSADSYGWQPSYVIENECEITCIKCLNGNAESYLESLENDPKTALNVGFGIDPIQYGYQLIRADFENGFHSGQTDDPKKIYKELRAEGYDRILFEINSVGQFDMHFRAWAKELPAKDGN